MPTNGTDLTDRELCQEKLDEAKRSAGELSDAHQHFARLLIKLAEAIIFQQREVYDITYEVRDRIDKLLERLESDDSELTIVLNELRQTLDDLQLKKR